MEKEKLAPLLVVDYMVLCHCIKYFYSEFRLLYSREVADKAARAAWATIINRGPDFLPYEERTIVVVVDEKFKEDEVYWRQREIARDERMLFAWEEYLESGKGKNITSKKYKGSRLPKTQEFLDLKNIGLDYCRQYFPVFHAEGFEADDWAGAIYRISRDTEGVCREREIFLMTLDRDWTMLVDDSHKVRWANTRIPKPNEHIQERLVKEAEVLYHTEYKLGETIEHPSDLAHAKHLQGDMGDNLPPGSPVEYFDLCEPHWKHSIESLGTLYNNLVRAVNDPEPNTKKDHLLKSLELFRKAGSNYPYMENYYANHQELYATLSGTL